MYETNYSKEFHLIWDGEKQPMIKQYAQMMRYNVHRHIVGNVPKRAVIWIEKGYVENYFDSESIDQIKKDSLRLLDEKEGRRLIEKTRQAIFRYREATRKLKNSHTKEELTANFEEFDRAIIELFSFFMTSTELVVHNAGEELKDILSTRYKGDYTEILLTLVSPTEPDLIYKEKESWLNVLKNHSPKQMAKHMESFPFLFFNLDSAEEAVELMKNRLKEKSINKIIYELDKSTQRFKEIEKAQKKIFGEIKSKKAEYLSYLLKTMALLRLDLKSCWSGMHFSLYNIFKKVADKAKCSIEDIMMLYSTTDIRNLIEFDIALPEEELKKRREKYLIYYYLGHITLFTGEDASKVRNILIKKLNTDVTIIKGMTTNRGYIKGRVKILKTENLKQVTNAKEFTEFTKEHILVTGMTNPALVPIIERVGGIITDEGGITCHASIISREFNIPCIVGTRIATQVLKDDDLVELDANKGIIKKIKH